MELSPFNTSNSMKHPMHCSLVVYAFFGMRHESERLIKGLIEARGDMRNV